MSDARRAALRIQASIARVILVFSWYTDVRELFLQLAKINVSTEPVNEYITNLIRETYTCFFLFFSLYLLIVSCCSHQVTNRQFLASEAWSTSGNLLQNLVTSQVASGVLGVAIRSSPIPGFESYLRNLNPSRHPDNAFLKEFWENEFGCSPGANRLLQKAYLPPCSGTESLMRVQNFFTDTSQLRVTYNVYLAVYAAAHALHSLLSCPNRDSPPGNNSATCSSPKHIKPREVNRHMYISTLS